MSGKGSSSSNNGSSSSGTGGSSSSSAPAPEPTIITGWEHSTYANSQTSYSAERYAYMGKDEDSGEPQWLDHGPKGGR